MKNVKKLICKLLVALLILNLFPSNSAIAASKIKLNKSKITIKVGQSKKIKIVGANKTHKKTRWKTSNKKIAKMSAVKNDSVKITAVREGKAQITAQIGNKKYSCKITVKKAEEAKQQDGSDATMDKPTAVPAVEPTAVTTSVPTVEPTAVTTSIPTVEPTALPTSVPTVVPTVEPTVAPVTSGFDDLKEYIKQNGVMNKINQKIINKTITSDDGSTFTYAIVNDETNDSLNFIMVGNNGSSWQESTTMKLKKNDNEGVADVLYLFGKTDGFEGTATILKSTFNKDSSPEITLLTGPKYNSENTAKELCVSTIRLAFSGWQLLLLDHGFQLADLGFTAY